MNDDRKSDLPEKRPPAASQKAVPSDSGFTSREEAAEEILRIILQRESEYPKLIAEKKLDAATAALRGDRLHAAWLYVLQPNLELTSAASYRNTWTLAEELLREAQAIKGKGARR